MFGIHMEIRYSLKHLKKHDIFSIPQFHLLYGEFPELDACGIQLPYKEANMAMLILLPNERTGILTLNDNINNLDLPHLKDRMYDTKVAVKLPRFHAEEQYSLIASLTEVSLLSK